FRQGSITMKIAKTFYSAPRGHASLQDFFFDGFGPRPHLFIAEKRHRSNLSWPMARLATFLQNWHDILTEGDRDGALGFCASLDCRYFESRRRPRRHGCGLDRVYAARRWSNDLARRLFRVNRYFHKAVQHLLPGLVPVVNIRFGIGVERVID